MSGAFQLSFASRITGTGSAFPEMKRTNNDLKQFMETDDEWIRERTGIRERRVSNTKNEAEVNSSFGLRAALQALEMAGKKAEDIDQIIYGTCSPQYDCSIDFLLASKKTGRQACCRDGRHHDATTHVHRGAGRGNECCQ